MNRTIRTAYRALRYIVIFSVMVGLFCWFMTSTTSVSTGYYTFYIAILTGCCVAVIACVIARIYLGGLLWLSQEETKELEKLVKAEKDKSELIQQLKIETVNRLNLFTTLVIRACHGNIDSGFLTDLPVVRRDDMGGRAINSLLILLMQGTEPLGERRRILIEEFLPTDWKKLTEGLLPPPGATAPEAQSE